MKLHYTKTQQALIDVFADGQPHYKTDLLAVIGDEYTSIQSLRNAVTEIRKKLPSDQTIICLVRNRRIYYQHVRLLFPPVPDNNQLEEKTQFPNNTGLPK